MASSREHLFISKNMKYNKPLLYGGIDLHASNRKAVSTLTLILLLLGSAIFGAFISYVWVMANFYLEPENTVELIITEASFPINHADYFNFTVMNPSHSLSSTNITEIYLTAEGDASIYNVTNTYPEELPIPVEKGTSKTVKCLKNWGEFAGKSITIHASAINASGAIRTVNTEFVKLELDVDFDASISCKQFNVTVTNHPTSALNLTLTKVLVNHQAPENTTIHLPTNLTVKNSVSFQCLFDWENLNPVVRVETAEGYYAEAVANASASILLLITDVTFSETDSNEISITILNSEVSSTPVDITDIVVAYSNGTEYYINGYLSHPNFSPYYALEVNETVTFDHCVWNWTNYRAKDVTITVYTKQGFTPVSKTVKTPPSIIFTTLPSFNLASIESFLVNVTNTASSLQRINVTQIKFNENVTEMTPSFLEVPVGGKAWCNCTFNWTSFRGHNVTITVYTVDGLNVLNSIVLPSIELKIPKEPTFAKTATGIPYVNITVLNTIFSAKKVTITQLVFETQNTADIIDGTLTIPSLKPDGCVLLAGTNTTVVCPWNWSLYLSQDLTITVQTADGYSISETFQIPESTP